MFGICWGYLCEAIRSMSGGFLGRMLDGCCCCCWLLVVGCLLFVVCLIVVCCLLFAVCCLLFVVCWLAFDVCCLLFAVCCLVFVVCCLFAVVCCCCLLVLDCFREMYVFRTVVCSVFIPSIYVFVSWFVDLLFVLKADQDVFGELQMYMSAAFRLQLSYRTR